MQKSFYKGTTRYEFSYEPDPNDPNPASVGTFDDEEDTRIRYFYPYIKSGDVVFDVGAAFGSYTLPALAIGAHVIAFSPEHEYELICKNIGLNDYKMGKDYAVYPYGLYSDVGYFKTDTCEFSKEDRTKENEGNWTGWWIRVVTLDSFIGVDAYGRIDYVKIDTEGAELEVLKGGIQTVKKYRPKLLLELHLFKNERIGLELMQFLKPLGYKTKVEQYTTAVSHMFAWV